MSLSKDDILNAIAEMSVMDVVELVEAMEEKFGVSLEMAKQMNLKYSELLTSLLGKDLIT